MQHPNISIREASLSFKNLLVFNNLTLTLRGGVWSCFLGPSGVGKSTLLKLIANLIPPSFEAKGQFFTDGSTHLSNSIAYMAQTDLLLPWLTVLDNTLLSHRLRGQGLQNIKKHALDLLDKVGLGQALKKYPHELSGGMRQRVALVRTLLQNKPIVLMDEPFSSVDAITRFELQNLASQLLNNHTVLFITHDPLEALRLANDIYILSGQPAVISKTIHLANATPRSPSDDEVLRHHTELFNALTKAKEEMA